MRARDRQGALACRCHGAGRPRSTLPPRPGAGAGDGASGRSRCRCSCRPCPRSRPASGSAPRRAQLVFSLSAFSIAVSMLFYGPISDRFGRRPALIGGLIVYLAGSVICAVAPTIAVLIVGRIVQAAGGCAGIVLTRAIVRDLYSLDRSATRARLHHHGDGRGADGGACAGRPAHRPRRLALGVRRRHGCGGADPGGRAWRPAGDRRRHRQASRSRNPLHGFGPLLRSPAFMGYALQGAFSISVFYAFLAAAPFLMLTVLHRPASEYGLMFVLVSGAFMVGNFVAGALLGPDRRRPHDPAGQPGLARRRAR